METNMNIERLTRSEYNKAISKLIFEIGIDAEFSDVGRAERSAEQS